MRLLSSLLWLVICVFLVGVIVIGLGIGIAYGLRLIMPKVDIGMALVAGAVFSFGIIDLLLRLMASVGASAPDAEEEETDLEEPILVIPSALWRRPALPKKRQKRK